MNAELLNKLSRITEEEQKILDGEIAIDRQIYMEGSENKIQATKLLTDGKLITFRPHTRFIHFPKHRHDYVEVVYMCKGSTTHIINGQRVTLRENELMFLSQNATQEIECAGIDDVAVNFIVLPDFFTDCIDTIEDEETPLKRFIVNCLFGKNFAAGYLHFKIPDVLEVQNLIENLILTLIGDSTVKRKISQMTMSLLFLELLNHTDKLQCSEENDTVAVQILRYIDKEFVSGTLAFAAEELHYDVAWLSRQIKMQTGKNFTQLIQERKLSQAAYLLRNTTQNISDIAAAVGYENKSFFYRIFQKTYGISPKHYRDKSK